MHLCEIRTWKTAKLNELLPVSSCWNAAKHLSARFLATTVAQHPMPQEFANNLAERFAGRSAAPSKPDGFTESVWNMDELRHALNA